MKKLILCTVLAVAGASTLAQTPPPPAGAASTAPMREKMKNMTPEQRAAKKAEMKAKWDAMTPEQQAAAKKRFGERHHGGGAHPAAGAASAAQ